MTTHIKNLFSKHKRLKHSIVLIAVIVFIIFPISLFYTGYQSMKNAYHTANQNTYNHFYETAYNYSEAQNHVSNYVNISIESAREVSRLEVLTVNSSEFIIKDSDENDKTISWLEVQGTGVFTVNLSASEFITDSEHQYVLVRIPKPALTECKVSTGKQFFKNNNIFSNGSIGDGVTLTQAQLSEGRLKLEDSIKQNRSFNDAAKEAAIYTIESLVHEWNPNIPDLQIEIEFIENENI